MNALRTSVSRANSLRYFLWVLNFDKTIKIILQNCIYISNVKRVEFIAGSTLKKNPTNPMVYKGHSRDSERYCRKDFKGRGDLPWTRRKTAVRPTTYHSLFNQMQIVGKLSVFISMPWWLAFIVYYLRHGVTLTRHSAMAYYDLVVVALFIHSILIRNSNDYGWMLYSVPS